MPLIGFSDSQIQKKSVVCCLLTVDFFLYLMKFDIEFMIIKPLRRTHVRIGNG